MAKNRQQKLARWLNGPLMLPSVLIASMAESTVVPIPLEAALIPLMQGCRKRLWQIALAATLGCLLGATIGYLAGMWLYDWLSPWLNSQFGQTTITEVQQGLRQDGFWYVFSAGVLPIPFQLAMVLSGAIELSFGVFLTAAVLARSVRYFGLALLVLCFGNQAQRIIGRYKRPAVAVLAGLVLCYVGYQLVSLG